MSQAKHTPGPWFFVNRKVNGSDADSGECLSIQTLATGFEPDQSICGIHALDDRSIPDARLIAAAPDLLEALEEYRIAHAMSSYGDYSAIEWESKAGPVNPDWGGGDCEKHGRWYGMCHCCRDEWKRLCDQSDRDAVRARNNALRAADDKANAAIAKATGCE